MDQSSSNQQAMYLAVFLLCYISTAALIGWGFYLIFKHSQRLPKPTGIENSIDSK